MVFDASNRVAHTQSQVRTESGRAVASFQQCFVSICVPEVTLYLPNPLNYTRNTSEESFPLLDTYIALPTEESGKRHVQSHYRWSVMNAEIALVVGVVDLIERALWMNDTDIVCRLDADARV